MDKLVRTRTAARLTGVNQNTIAHWAADGRLKNVKRDGKLYLVDTDEVMQLSRRLRPGPRSEEPAQPGKLHARRVERRKPPPDGMVPIRSASQATGLPVTTIRHWCNHNQIVAHKDGIWYVSLDAVQERAKQREERQ